MKSLHLGCELSVNWKLCGLPAIDEALKKCSMLTHITVGPQTLHEVLLGSAKQSKVARLRFVNITDDETVLEVVRHAKKCLN